MNLSANFLICLAGLPSSGKTTFARRFKNILERNQINPKVEIIDPDKIRYSISPDEFDHEKEKIVRERTLKAVKSALEKGKIVISDDLNYYTSMRHDLKEMADNFKVKFFIVHISTPLKTCLEWNEFRGTPIPNDLIQNIHEKFDNFDRYSWDFAFDKFDFSKKIDLNEIIEQLIDRIYLTMKRSKNNLKEKVIENRELMSNNQKLDRVTRRIIGILLQEPRFHSIKNRLIKNRKIFIKNNLNSSLNELEMKNTFIKHLERALKIKIATKFHE